MSRRLSQERGSVLVTAVLVSGVMLGLGLGVFAFVDGQQAQASRERMRESSFQVAESALNSAAAFLAMSGRWPTATAPYPACTNASTSLSCPHPASVRAGFTAPQFSGATWTTSVRDNGTGPYYSDTQTAGQPAYDVAGDGIWLRSEATVQGATRVLVQLISRETLSEQFPQNGITAGFFGTGNNGKKQMVSSNSLIAVRCTTSPPSPCLNYYPSRGQVGTAGVMTGYSGSLDPGLLSRLRQEAQAAGTYHTSCPASFSGAVVFIESGNCTMGTTSNSKAAPGVLVLANGTITVSGSAIYYGLVYNACLQNPTSYTNVVSITGSAQVSGSIYVDGQNCGVSIGNAAKTAFIYDPNVLGTLTTRGPVRAVSNTWRQVK